MFGESGFEQLQEVTYVPTVSLVDDTIRAARVSHARVSISKISRCSSERIHIGLIIALHILIGNIIYELRADFDLQISLELTTSYIPEVNITADLYENRAHSYEQYRRHYIKFAVHTEYIYRIAEVQFHVVTTLSYRRCSSQ